MIYEKMKKESQRLDEQIQQIQSQLNTLPKGKLICASNGNRYKWYRSDGHKSTYLSKKERHLAEKLAYKKYLSLQLKNLIHEKNAIDFYLKHHDRNAYETEQALINSPHFKDLLAPHFTPLSKELQDWANTPYNRNMNHPENLTNHAYSGNVVRSKSEALIDMFLYKNKVPFRYECPLELDGIIIYPDFTIRHPETGEVFYWERFGLMDNPSYSKSACSKLQLYISNGIIPSIHLITTYETKDNPLDAGTIEKIVEHYFL